ncbi:MAG: phosphatidate cytidylyltransferase [Candidatus Acidiferrales bacterium]
MTLTRVLTAAILIPAVIALIWWGPPLLVAACGAAVAVLALLEFFSLGERVGLKGYRFWTCVCGVFMFFQQWQATLSERTSLTRDIVLLHQSPLFTASLEMVLLLFVFGAGAIAVFSSLPLADVLPDLGISAAALHFVALPFTAAVRLDAIAPRLLLFALVMIWVGDSFAYFVGRAVGRTKMAAQLSPKKTWEGAVANLAGSLLVGALSARWVGISKIDMLAMAALGNIAGQFGDLLESAYKRSAGVKDSGTLLPGHGGMLDRIDALVLSLPVVWYYFQLVVAAR